MLRGRYSASRTTQLLSGQFLPLSVEAGLLLFPLIKFQPVLGQMLVPGRCICGILFARDIHQTHNNIPTKDQGSITTKFWLMVFADDRPRAAAPNTACASTKTTTRFECRRGLRNSHQTIIDKPVASKEPQWAL